jgi:Plant transposon protein
MAGSVSGKGKAYADYNMWIWHASFGYAGTLNDINIWEQSPLLNAFVDGSFTKEVDFEFSIGGVTFDKVWLLVDGIYPKIERFAKTYDEAIGEERKI